MFINLEPDVKDSSGGSSTTETIDVKTTESSTVETPQSNQPSGLSAVLKKTLDKHLEAETKKEEAVKAEEDSDKKEETVEETKEETKEETEKQDDEGKEEEKVEEGKAVPYNRFKEVNDAKVQAEAKLKEAEGYVNAHKSVMSFCQQHEISPKDFQFWMDIAALSNVDPARALQALAPKVNAMQSFTGTVLSPELEAAVEAGEMTKEWAMKLAKAQGTSKLTQAQQERMVKQTQAQQEAALQREFATAVGDWETSKKRLDPDFKPKAANAKDGKYEIWLAKFSREANLIEDLSAEALVQAANRAYDSVAYFVTSLAPKTTNGKTLRTSQSTTSVVAPKTVREAIAARAKAEHGIEMPLK